MTLHSAIMTPEQLLRRSTAELQRCLEIVARVEDGVIPLVSTPIAPSLRAALQDIDLLSQCIDDIARCVSGLAESVHGMDGRDMTAIMRLIKLQDMRVRLEGGTMDSRKLVQREDMFVEF
jgi:hypothetical protein